MASSFEKDLFSKEDYNLLCLAGGYKYAVYNGGSFVLEGHKGVKKYDKSQMLFRVPNGVVKVEGENLKIAQMTKNFVLLTGKIFSCGVENE
jgi:sporulation protein YqfC